VKAERDLPWEHLGQLLRCEFMLR